MPDPAAEADPGAEVKAIQAILHAAHYAAEKHAGQKRKGAAAEPYFNHLLEVAHLVINSASRRAQRIQEVSQELRRLDALLAELGIG